MHDEGTMLLPKEAMGMEGTACRYQWNAANVVMDISLLMLCQLKYAN